MNTQCLSDNGSKYQV